MKLEAEKCTPYLLDGAGGWGGGGGDGARGGWACGGGASIGRDGAREGWSFQRRIPPRRRRRRPGGAAPGAEGDGGGDDVGAAPRPHAARRRRRRWRVAVVGWRNFWERLKGYFVVCPFDLSSLLSFFFPPGMGFVYISFPFALLAWLVWPCAASFVNPLFGAVSYLIINGQFI